MNTLLHINVESLRDSLDRAAQTMEAIEKGTTVEKYNGINFSEVGQMLSVFTPKRWELIEALRNHGYMSIRALATLLKRDYKNVHSDVSALMTWGVIEKNDDALIFVPHDELIFDVKLPRKKAA